MLFVGFCFSMFYFSRKICPTPGCHISSDTYIYLHVVERWPHERFRSYIFVINLVSETMRRFSPSFFVILFGPHNPSLSPQVLQVNCPSIVVTFNEFLTRERSWRNHRRFSRYYRGWFSQYRWDLGLHHGDYKEFDILHHYLLFYVTSSFWK